MVYLWTYDNPLYCPSTYKQVVLTDVVGPMDCRSDWYVKNSIYWCIQPTLSCSLDMLVGLMGLFRRSDGLF